MQIRVFTVDEDGFSKIRPEDLERMLNDAYEEGFNKNTLIIGFQEPKEPPKDAVYPTWAEWLGTKYGYDLREILYEPIQADLAQKLGVEPKK